MSACDYLKTTIVFSVFLFYQQQRSSASRGYMTHLLLTIAFTQTLPSTNSSVFIISSLVIIDQLIGRRLAVQVCLTIHHRLIQASYFTTICSGQWSGGVGVACRVYMKEMYLAFLFFIKQNVNLVILSYPYLDVYQRVFIRGAVDWRLECSDRPTVQCSCQKYSAVPAVPAVPFVI